MRVAELLKKAQIEELRSEMEIVLAFLLEVSRLDLLAHSEREVPAHLLGTLQKHWVELKQGRPVAYITNKKEFYGMDLYVDERVLIPRGETEQMVEYALKLLPKGGRVLELGTGSGAISLALKKTRPDLEVIAGDVSLEALEVANKNCVQLGLEVDFVESDLLEKIPHQDFDLLLANLPYIGEESHDFLADNVRAHEPSLALFGGPDGLDLYRRLFQQIVEGKWDIPVIIGEIGFSQGKTIEAVCHSLLPQYSFDLNQDLQGLDRHFLLQKL